MKIREIMRPSWSIRADDTLWRAERIMARRRNKHLPILDGGGKLAGILSERDIVAFRAGSPDPDWWLVPVRDVMRDAAVTAGPDEPVSVAPARIAASPDALLPVVEHDFLVGVVTATDLLDAELRSWASAPTEVTAADVMTEAPVTVSPADDLVEATKLMSDRHIRHLPVVEEGHVVGMLSERDLLPVADELSKRAAHRDRERELKVGDAMTKSVATVSAGTSITDVSRTLLDFRIGAVPVVDAERRPIGIVSYVDVLRALAA